MLSLLETLLTFVGIMLVLALAAESLQELVKAGFALKGQAALRGLRGLISEAVKSRGLTNSGEEIYQSIVRRLQGLGQNGVRPTALRLDALTDKQLADLLRSVNPAEISDLKNMQHQNAGAELEELAETAKRWFPMAMDPVADRYRRRMRGLAFLSSAVVVWALNADAITLFRRARDDDQFRQHVNAATAELSGLQKRVQELTQRCGTPATTDTTRASADSVCQRELEAARDTARVRGGQIAADTTFIAGLTGPRRPKEIKWWIGILLSTFLVSLGAPFWHDTLETLFGIKNRVRAQAKKLEETTPPMEVERQRGPEKEKVVKRPADEALPL
jgi:hypothetical protein